MIKCQQKRNIELCYSSKCVNAEWFDFTKDSNLCETGNHSSVCRLLLSSLSKYCEPNIVQNGKYNILPCLSSKSKSV